jgi:hypothetical protein
VIYENDIENMKTTDIYLQLENPETTYGGTVQNYSRKVWEDGTEEEETWSTPVEGEGDMTGEYSMALYFKYPVD